MTKVDVGRLREEFREPHDLLRTSDGATLFLRRWEAPSEPAVTVLLFHGITAHSGPYGPRLAEPLARAGVTVYGLDMRGHGLSDGRRGDLPGPERFARDVREAVAFVKARSRSLVVLGHSLGGLSAGLAVQQCPDDLRGLLLLGVGRQIRSGVYRQPSARSRLKSLLGATLFRSVPLIEYRREGMLGLDDPLFNFQYSVRFYTTVYGVSVGSLLTMLRTGSIDSPRLRFDRPLGIPLLVGVGDQDELFSLDSARALSSAIGGRDTTFWTIPGAHHATFPPEAPEGLVRWLSERFGGAPTQGA